MHHGDGSEMSYQAPLHNLCQFRCYASRLIHEVQRRQGQFGLRSMPCMKVGYSYDTEMLWKIWNPEIQRVKCQSGVIFDKERNAHTSCQHGTIEIDMFGLPENEYYVEETDTGDKPLRDSQPTRICHRSKSHIPDAPGEKAENADSWRLRRNDQTAQYSAADVENIAHSQHLRRQYHPARHSAAAIKNSNQVPPDAPAPAPAPPIGSRVTRN